MKTRFKQAGFAVLSAVVLLAATACGSKDATGGQASPAQSAEAAKEVKLGLSAPLTGDRAQYGQSFSNAIKLAVNEYNAKNPKVKVKLVEADSKDDPKEAANIAQKFVDDKDVVAVVGDFSSNTSMAASPIYQRSGLVQLSPTSSHPEFTKTGDYIFRNVPTQKIEGAFVADYAKDLGFKKAVTIYIQNDWGLAAKDNFESRFKSNGGEVLASLNYNPDTKDFNNILIKVKEKNPDVIYLGSPYLESALIAQQAKKLNLNVKFIGTGILYSQEFIKLGGDAVEGTYTDSSFYPNDPRPETKTFVDTYNKTYNKEPDMFAGVTYDAANMILAVVGKGETSRKGIRDALAQTKDYPGVTGKTSYDADRNVNKDLAKLVVKDGKFTLNK